jgi:methyltransferase (TIGR00027 family)
MPRTDNDSWDLASSVGATATMVATARALASRPPDSLINDPFAEPLARAVGIDFFERLLNGEIRPDEVEANQEFNVQWVIHSIAVRTRFFDGFFTTAAEAGVRQAVILASGLDARAYRLPWPAGTVVFEIDLPDVLEFKRSTLSELGAHPTAEHRPVPIDLRDDWPAALRDNGFDQTAPAAWSAEGLLLYLPPEAQDRLFDNITALSASGSRLATEYHPDGGALMRSRVSDSTNRWAEHGFDVDFSQLFYDGERSQVVDYLTKHGWQTSTQTRAKLFTEAGLPLPTGDAAAPLRNTVAVTAIRDGLDGTNR